MIWSKQCLGFFLLSFQIKNLIIFDLINNENRLSRYETEEAVPKLKVTQQLIEEIYTAHDPHPRPKPCPIKPMRSAIKWLCNIVVKILGHLSIVVQFNSCNIDILIFIFDVYGLCFFSLIRLFQPVQYGTKPEGRLASITSAAGQRPPTSSPSSTSASVSTTSQSAQARGKSPITVATTTASSHGKGSSGLKQG